MKKNVMTWYSYNKGIFIMLEEDYRFQCPYCWSDIAIRLDPTGGKKQDFSHDCEVCCRPIRINVEYGNEGLEDFKAEAEHG